MSSLHIKTSIQHVLLLDMRRCTKFALLPPTWGVASVEANINHAGGTCHKLENIGLSHPPDRKRSGSPFGFLFETNQKGGFPEKDTPIQRYDIWLWVKK